MTASFRTCRALGVLLPTLLGPSTALAQEDATSVDIHGFVSQGFIKSTENNYLGPSERGSFELTEAAINFTHSPLDDLRIGVQLFARDIGPYGNYTPGFDWYYLDYHFFDWLGVRAGRTKLPFGLYNEVNDVDAARVPILMPSSIYPVDRRGFLLAQTGVELYGDVSLGVAGSLSYRAYGGTVHIDPSDLATPPRSAQVPYSFGGRLMWFLPIEGLSFGGSVQAGRLDLETVPTAAELAGYTQLMVLPPDFGGTVSTQLHVVLAVASIEYEHRDALVAAEYTLQTVEREVSLLVPSQHTDNHGLYVLAAYRVAPWLTPGAYYSLRLPDPAGRTGPGKYQHDVAVTLRHDINAHWLLKLEGHYMRGTADLLPDQNGGTPREDLESSWGVFLVKTTAYF